MTESKKHPISEVIQEPFTPEEADRVVADALNRLETEGIRDLSPGQERTIWKAGEEESNG